MTPGAGIPADLHGVDIELVKEKVEHLSVGGGVVKTIHKGVRVGDHRMHDGVGRQPSTFLARF